MYYGSALFIKYNYKKIIWAIFIDLKLVPKRKHSEMEYKRNLWIQIEIEHNHE